MQLVILIVIVIILCSMPLIPFCITHVPDFIYHIPKDLINYFKYRRWNECKAFGTINCYCGLFGQGKTLSLVHYVVNQYKQFNGKYIYDVQIKKWVKQVVQVYSNVVLQIPYIPLTSAQQIVDCQSMPNNVVSLFLIDEASVVFNSRDFKNNFSTPVLNSILTCRHFKVGVFMSAQRFSHIDALLRQVTNKVIQCALTKSLRIQRNYVYDAYSLENCTNPDMVQPLVKRYWFVKDKDYNAYDTYALVGDLSKQATEGKMLSDQEIINLRGEEIKDLKLVRKQSKKGRKRLKR